MPGQGFSRKISLAFLRQMSTASGSAQSSIFNRIQEVIVKEFKPDQFKVTDISGGCGESFEVTKCFWLIFRFL
jgi:hypothetical protein